MTLSDGSVAEQGDFFDSRWMVLQRFNSFLNLILRIDVVLLLLCILLNPLWCCAYCDFACGGLVHIVCIVFSGVIASTRTARSALSKKFRLVMKFLLKTTARR